MGCEPNDPKTPEIKGVGAFSISFNNQVTFAPSNLVYNRVDNKWHLADNPWDILGAKILASPSYDYQNPSESIYNYMYISDVNMFAREIDVFGWGTGNNPTLVGEDYTDFPVFAEWGKNIIGNDRTKQWRTLTKDEWEYILFKRYDADKLLAYIIVDGHIGGLLLFPDNWVHPDGIKLTTGFNPDFFAGYNYLDSEEVLQFQEKGAIFLPSTAKRFPGEYRLEGSYMNGYYWTSSAKDEQHSYAIKFTEKNIKLVQQDPATGIAVRLAKDLTK
jgi:hypothetical protein